MKYSKRAFVTILLTVFAMCFSLSACQNNGVDSTSQLLSDHSTPDTSAAAVVSAGDGDSPAESNSMPSGMSDYGDKEMPVTENETKIDYDNGYDALLTELEDVAVEPSWTETDILLSNFVGKKTFEYKITDNHYLSAAYPILQGLGTESRTAEINSQFVNFTNEIDYVDSCYKEGSICKYEIRFSIVQDTSKEFILRTYYMYSDSGPYPKYGSRYYTFDVKTGKQKELADYFAGVQGYRERILKYLQEMIDEDFDGSVKFYTDASYVDGLNFAVYNGYLHISLDRGELTNSWAPSYEIPMDWIINGRNW